MRSDDTDIIQLVANVQAVLPRREDTFDDSAHCCATIGKSIADGGGWFEA